MSKKILIFLYLISPLIAFADNRSDAVAAAQAIKENTDYIYGEGWGETPGDADQMALANLLSKIGISAQSTLSVSEEETANNDGLEYKADIKSVLNTYSQATITNTETCSFRDGDKGFYILRYMKRTELEKMFNQRRERVEDYVRSAFRAEEKGRVDDALRFYNWAFIMLHSLQYPGEVRMKIGGEEQLLLNWIPMQVKEILENVEAAVAEIKPDNTIDMLFTYKGRPVEGLDFTYWNGKFNSPLTGVKDGMSQLSFPPDYTPQEIILSVETRYEEAAMSDKELEIMISNFKPVSYSASRKVIGTDGKQLKEDKEAKKDLQAAVESGKKEGIAALDEKQTKDYQRIMDEIIKSIRNKDYSDKDELFTPEGREMFTELLSYGSASLVGNPDPGFYPMGDRVVCRSVPMQFKFMNNNRIFTEDVTFTFSPDKKIESVAFGLGNAARRDIFKQGGDVWGDSIKMVIVTFLENYKTAFALKRLDYIKNIFDENAYIIVGHKLQKLQAYNDKGGFSVGTQYEFQRKTKEEYITQLEKCFKSNEYVNINFSDNDIQKAAFGGNTFGIQIKQDYYSQHYGDQGYLFLFVDLNEADKPIIKIRTWQPERNGDITPMIPKSSRDYGIYGIYSFE